MRALSAETYGLSVMLAIIDSLEICGQRNDLQSTNRKTLHIMNLPHKSCQLSWLIAAALVVPGKVKFQCMNGE